MKFSDFKSVKQVIEKYPLAIHRESFLPNIEIEPPAGFLQELNFALMMQSEIESQMFFREYFIAPFMRHVWMRHPRLKLWVNQNLAYKDELTGAPDYFVARRVETVSHELVGKPLLAVAEAKQEDFIAGWGQCLAEMIACQKLNERGNITIYGIVSTGIYWEFGKLAGDTFTKNTLSYSINHPAQVLGALDTIFATCEQEISG